MSLFGGESGGRLNSLGWDSRVVFIHSLWSDLQFILRTEYVSPLSLGVWSSLAKEVCELCG